MAEFIDGKKRTWLVAIDVPLIEQVQDRVGVTLDALLVDECKGLSDLLGPGNAVKFGRVLWVLVEEQAKRDGVAPEQFARAIWGDALEDAAIAFTDALADFSPRRQRTILRALMAKGAELAEQQTARAVDAIASLSSASATNSPGSSGSTPDAKG